VTPAPHDRQLLARLLGPARPEVSCETCFELLDEYVEAELAGADADARLPGMREHLEGCPACREDHASLRALVASEPGGPGGPGGLG
jgi:anti-sigma factor RsiW